MVQSDRTAQEEDVFRMNRILPRGVVRASFASSLVLVGVNSIPQSVLAAAIDPKEIWLSGVDPVVLHDRDKNAADKRLCGTVQIRVVVGKGVGARAGFQGVDAVPPSIV